MASTLTGNVREETVKRMKFLLLGATGTTGSQFINQALAARS